MCSVVGDWGPWDGCLGESVYHKRTYMSAVKGYLNCNSQ